MADKTDLSLPSSQPSLQELCEKEVLSQILQSDSAVSDIPSLEPRLRHIPRAGRACALSASNFLGGLGTQFFAVQPTQHHMVYLQA
jgi:hypothetical protein